MFLWGRASKLRSQEGGARTGWHIDCSVINGMDDSKWEVLMVYCVELKVLLRVKSEYFLVGVGTVSNLMPVAARSSSRQDCGCIQARRKECRDQGVRSAVGVEIIVTWELAPLGSRWMVRREARIISPCLLLIFPFCSLILLPEFFHSSILHSVSLWYFQIFLTVNIRVCVYVCIHTQKYIIHTCEGMCI